MPPRQRWRRTTPTGGRPAAYARTSQNASTCGPSSPDSGVPQLGNDPSIQWQLRSVLDLPANQELDIAVRHVGALPNPAVPAYTALDARWAWRAMPGFEVSIVGQNLADAKHVEWSNRAEVARSVFLYLRWSR